jgi:hypothetical protein
LNNSRAEFFVFRNIPHGISPPGGFGKKLQEDNPRHTAQEEGGGGGGALQPPDITETFPSLRYQFSSLSISVFSVFFTNNRKRYLLK